MPQQLPLIMEIIDWDLVLFVVKNAISDIKAVFLLVFIVSVVHLLADEHEIYDRQGSSGTSTISFEFNGELFSIDLNEEITSEDINHVDVAHNESDDGSELSDLSLLDCDKEETTKTPVTSTNECSENSLNMHNDYEMDTPEVIKNSYATKFSFFENLRLIKDEEKTLLSGKNNSEYGSDDNVTITDTSSEVFKSSCLQNYTKRKSYSLEPIPSSGCASSIRSVSVSSQRHESQLPVKDLIVKFESISSNASIKSADHSFLNKNILNKGNTRGSEGFNEKKRSVNGIPTNTNQQLYNEGFETPKKQNAAKTEGAHSVSSKASTSVFFTPYIQSALNKTSPLKRGSNALTFRDDKSSNESLLSTIGVINTTSSFTTSVATQDVVATGTIISPDVYLSTTN